MQQNRDLLPHFERFLLKKGLPEKQLAFYRHVYGELDRFSGQLIVELEVDAFDEFYEATCGAMPPGRQKAYHQVLEHLVEFQLAYFKAREARGAAPSPALISRAVEPGQIDNQYGLYGAGTLDDDVSQEMPGASTQAINAAPLVARMVTNTQQNRKGRSFIRVPTKRKRGTGQGISEALPELTTMDETPVPDNWEQQQDLIQRSSVSSLPAVEQLSNNLLMGNEQASPPTAGSGKLDALFQDALDAVESHSHARSGADSFFSAAGEPADDSPSTGLSSEQLFGDISANEEPQAPQEALDFAFDDQLDLSNSEPQTPQETPPPAQPASPYPGLPLPPSAQGNSAPPSSGIPGLPLPPSAATAPPPSGMPGLPLPPSAASRGLPPSLTGGAGGALPTGGSPAPNNSIQQVDTGAVAFSKLGMLQGGDQNEKIAVADDDEPLSKRGKGPKLRAAVGVQVQMPEANRTRLTPSGDRNSDELEEMRQRLMRRIERASSSSGKKRRRAFRPYLWEKQYLIDQSIPKGNFQVLASKDRSLVGGFSASAKLFVPGVVFLVLAVFFMAVALGSVKALSFIGPAGWILAGILGFLGLILFWPGFKIFSLATQPTLRHTPQVVLTNYYAQLWHQNFEGAYSCLAATDSEPSQAPTFDPSSELPIGQDFNHLPLKFFKRYWQVHSPSKHLSWLAQLRLQLNPPELGKTHIISGSVNGGAVLLLIEGPQIGWYILVPLIRLDDAWYITDGQLFPRPEGLELPEE